MIWIADNVLESMEVEADNWTPLESGGILLGYYGSESHEPVVTHFVGPGPKAIHCEDRFEPDYDYQNAEIARLYSTSGRTLHYLGDWHSHPNGNGYLSGKDRDTFFRILRSKDARAARPIMVVLAWKNCWTAHAWQLKPQKSFFQRHPVPVSLIVKPFYSR